MTKKKKKKKKTPSVLIFVFIYGHAILLKKIIEYSINIINMYSSFSYEL